LRFICDAHWQELQKAVADRGLTHLTQNGEDYDPLLAATFAIWGNSLEAFGLSILKPEAPCPLCVLDKHVRECTDESCESKDTGSDWIRYAADGQMDQAAQQGLLGKPN